MNPLASRCLLLALFACTSGAALAHTAPPAPPAAKSGGTPVGVVAFANSGAAAAQADFQYGVAQLHNFQYPDAAAAFRRAQQADPGFALAYWGEAMTHNHTIWMRQDTAQGRAVLARLAPDRDARLARAGTERERAYLEAVEILYGEGDKLERDRRYAAAMRRLHERWSEDVDGTAFYALALLGTAHHGRDVPTYMRSYALVADLFRDYPQHPGIAHYLIHSVDDAAHAPLGLKAARAYGAIAPESAHALHMTSHIFLALGLWDDVVAANEAAMAEQARRATKAGAPALHCGHAPIWLNYGYLQQGRAGESKRLLAACLTELRERPQLAAAGDQFEPDTSSLGSFYAMRLRYLLDGPADDAEVRSWTPPVDGSPLARFLRDYGAALDAYARGTPQALQSAVALAQESAAALAVAMDGQHVAAQSPYRTVLAIQRRQLDGLWRVRSGDRDGGLAELRAAAEAETLLPAAYGPPQVDQSTHELLGWLLLDAGAPAEARAQFERALALNPGRVAARRGLLQATRAVGDGVEGDAIQAALRETLAQADVGGRADGDRSDPGEAAPQR